MDFSGFFEKLRAAVQNKENTEADAPTERPFREAYRDGTEKVAIPFSFQTNQNGARQYGLAYIPASEARKYADDNSVHAAKLGNTGATPLDYTIISAELSDGRKIDSDMFKDMYNTFKKAKFQFGDEWGIIDANDDVMMRETRKYLRRRQEESTNSASQNFFRNLKLNNMKGRA